MKKITLLFGIIITTGLTRNTYSMQTPLSALLEEESSDGEINDSDSRPKGIKTFHQHLKVITFSHVSGTPLNNELNANQVATQLKDLFKAKIFSRFDGTALEKVLIEKTSEDKVHVDVFCIITLQNAITDYNPNVRSRHQEYYKTYQLKQIEADIKNNLRKDVTMTLHTLFR